MARDARGLALVFVLICEQASEMRAAPSLLAALSTLGQAGRIVCDRAYSSRPWRLMIVEAGAAPCVPANRTHPPVTSGRRAYARRHKAENLWGRPKEWRAVSTRYNKTAASYQSALYIAAIVDWVSDRA